MVSNVRFLSCMLLFKIFEENELLVFGFIIIFKCRLIIIFWGYFFLSRNFLMDIMLEKI